MYHSAGTRVDAFLCLRFADPVGGKDSIAAYEAPRLDGLVQ